MKEYRETFMIDPRENPMTGRSYISYDDNNNLIFLRRRFIAPTWPILWPLYYIIRRQYVQLLVSMLIYIPVFALMYYSKSNIYVVYFLTCIFYFMYTSVFNNKISGYYYTKEKKMKQFTETYLKLKVLDENTELSNIKDITIVNCYYYEDKNNVLFFENDGENIINVYCSQYNDKNLRKIAKYIHSINYKYLRLNLEYNKKIPETRYSNLFIKFPTNIYEKLMFHILTIFFGSKNKSNLLTGKPHDTIIKYISWHLFLSDEEKKNDKYIVLDGPYKYNDIVILNHLHGFTKPLDFIFSFGQRLRGGFVFTEDYYFTKEDKISTNEKVLEKSMKKIKTHLNLRKDILSIVGYKTLLYINGQMESDFINNNYIEIETDGVVELKLDALIKPGSQKFEIEEKEYELKIRFNYYRIALYIFMAIILFVFQYFNDEYEFPKEFSYLYIFVSFIVILYLSLKTRKIKIKEVSK